MISWLQTFMVSKIIWLVYSSNSSHQFNRNQYGFCCYCNNVFDFCDLHANYIWLSVYFFTYLTKRCDSKLYSSTTGKCDDDAKLWLVFATILWRVTMATRLYWRIFFFFLLFFSVCLFPSLPFVWHSMFQLSVAFPSLDHSIESIWHANFISFDILTNHLFDNKINSFRKGKDV